MEILTEKYSKKKKLGGVQSGVAREIEGSMVLPPKNQCFPRRMLEKYSEDTRLGKRMLR